jgi:hypothetical protein
LIIQEIKTYKNSVVPVAKWMVYKPNDRAEPDHFFARFLTEFLRREIYAPQ